MLYRVGEDVTRMERFFPRLRFDGGRKIASTPAPERAEGLDVFWRGYVCGPDAAPVSRGRRGRNPSTLRRRSNR